VTITLPFEQQARSLVSLSAAVSISSLFVLLFPRSVASRIHRQFPIDCRRHEFIGSRVLELDDLMPLSCEFPSAGGVAVQFEVHRASMRAPTS
jgi:hypothetical protein